MPPPSPFDAILAQSRDLMGNRTCEAVGRMLSKAEDVLSTLASKVKEEADRKTILEARDFATSQRGAIEAQFRSRYQSEFDKRVRQAKKIGQSFAEISLDTLELVAEDDLDEALRYKDLATRLRRFCDDELGALDQRVAVLMGDANLESDANAFNPQAICEAFRGACRQLDSSVPVRMALIKLFDEDAATDIRATYHAVNDLLVENGILPKIRYGISKQEGGAKPAPSSPDKAKEAPAEAPAAPQDIFSMLQKLLPAGPAPAAGAAGVPQLQGPELLSSLTRLQLGDASGVTGETDFAAVLANQVGTTNVLRELKATSVGAAMGQVDGMTLDIVALLFDQIFDDPKIPAAMKGLIARLQIPMLKVAIADKALFSDKQHPARQLLDTLGDISLRLPAEFDESSPLYGRLDRFIHDLVEGFQEKLEIFDTVRDNLAEIVAEHDARVAQEMEEESKRLRQAESLALAKAVAQQEIQARVESSPPPQAVAEFLAHEWIKHMVIVHARDGDASAAWIEAIETMNDLLRSVEAKPTAEDRKQLVASIPSLLKRLRAGVAAAGIDEAKASAFFSQLMACHAEIMHTAPPAPRRRKGSTEPEPAPKPVPVNLDFSAPVTVDNPFGGGRVEVDSEDLDFTAVAASPAPAAAGATAAGSSPSAAKPRARETIWLPSLLVEGRWVDIVDETGFDKRAAQLYYVSPMKSHFLFVDRKGRKVYECSRSVLATRLKRGEVILLESEPDASLFDRIMEGLFGKLGAQAPA